ncbi:MAG: hypothetical protein SFU83_21985 [Meiothermus sp.]|nr:hypothetical protein [Meiothermus sp.]
MEYEVDGKTLRKISLEFRSLASRLLSSDVDDSSANLQRLIAFIDSNELISSFVQGFALLPEVDAYQLKKGEERGGGGRWNIPVAKDLEIGCTYVLLKWAVEEKREYTDLAWGYSHGSRFQDHVDGFNRSVVNPFVAHIVEYLHKLMIDSGLDESGKTTVHVTQGSAYIAGSVNQSMLSLGSATISGSTIGISTKEQLKEVLLSLRDDLATIEPQKRDEVGKAIEILVGSAEGEQITKAELVQSIELIGKSSPSMRQKLEDVASNALGGLAGTAIIEAIKFAFDIAVKSVSGQ